MSRFLAVCLTMLIASASHTSAQSIEHGIFDALLQRHVTVDGLVDYDAFAASEDFDRYLELLDRTDPQSLPRNDRLALWINAYNAYTIKLINDHDERESIRNINQTLGVIAAKGPWTEPIANVGGTTYTLDEIEHEIIREQFDEPRIHFALVCAAMGCPSLRREAYVGARLDEQLDEQARRFLLQAPEKNRVDVSAKTVHLNKVFEWYGGDFGDDETAIAAYLARFYPPGPERQLLESGEFDIEYTDYDWSLNAR